MFAEPQNGLVTVDDRVAATDTLASLLECVPRGRLLSPKPLDEVELDAGQWTADVVQGIAIGERPKIDRDQPCAVDQFDHQLFGFAVVAGSKDDGTGFVRREILYPGHRHIADRFNQPCANRHFSDYLA